nr:hypothetical protein [Tanacetum cinerariifolium]
MTKILEEYSEAVIDEEKILAQKAKIQWLSEGDINNKYFHQILKVGKNSSRIVSVCDAKRKWYNEDEVVEKFINHFQTFLGGNGEDPIIEDAENVFALKLSENEASAITRDVTDMEIKEELLKGYKLKTSPQRCAMKIDIAKAKWIMTCVTTVVFTLNINEDICGYFKGDKGLRQGDPITPYLFTLVMEVLTLMMGRKVGQNGNSNSYWM